MSKSKSESGFSIIDPEMTVKAMRDSGYKSTTHALAELIDNSIESGASAIQVFGVSRRSDRAGRFTLKELAVLDNGEGMDRDTLRGSLRYGHGTRREREGIGRFGLGLPNSSMSQARRVDVWSWKSGPTNALRTRLWLDDIEKGTSEIPEPTLEPIPKVYLDESLHTFTESGTLVVWTELDRVEWKQASTTFRHTERLIGRIYRRFLANRSERLHPDHPRGDEIGPRRTISLIPIQQDDGKTVVKKEEVVKVQPNDPLYLMTGTSCPENFGPGPMFKELEGSPFSIPVKHFGEQYDVLVRASYARAHVRDSSASNADWPDEWRGKDAGNAPWGKHANQNLGVSLIRSHREIQLDESWVSVDYRERWWKVEVDFPTALDEVFGVTNNKQGTMTFQRLARYDWRRELIAGEHSEGDVRMRMKKEGDPRLYLLDLRKQISNAITHLRSRAYAAKQVRGSRHVRTEEQKADAKATAAINRRIVDGYTGESDKAGQSGSEEEHREAQIESLTQRHHLDRTDALMQIDETLRTGSLVKWIQTSQKSPAFFDVESLPNMLLVALNTAHPVHEHLYDILHPEVDKMTNEEVRERLAKVAAAFRILIYSWARYEEEQQHKKHQRQVQDARWEWGKYARDFFDETDDAVPPTDLV